MDHKPFAVIAPVAVAAILILGILAGISSTAAAQLSKLVKKPYVSKPVKSYVSKTVKTPYVSKTVKTPYVSKTQMIFTAKLSGSNAIPPVNTPATGIARFELSSNGKVLNYHLSTTNLKGFKDANICEKVQNTNYTTNKTYETCDGVAGSLSMGKGKITSDDLYGRFEDAPLSDLIKSMRSGELYVAVDTQQHHWYPPGTGEIFGHIRSGG
jgi:CHRD domain